MCIRDRPFVVNGSNDEDYTVGDYYVSEIALSKCIVAQEYQNTRRAMPVFKNIENSGN